MLWTRELNALTRNPDDIYDVLFKAYCLEARRKLKLVTTLEELDHLDEEKMDAAIWRRLIGRYLLPLARQCDLMAEVSLREQELRKDAARPRATFQVGSKQVTWYRDAGWYDEPLPAPCPTCGSGELKVLHSWQEDVYTVACLNSACGVEFPEVKS